MFLCFDKKRKMAQNQLFYSQSFFKYKEPGKY